MGYSQRRERCLISQLGFQLYFADVAALAGQQQRSAFFTADQPAHFFAQGLCFHGGGAHPFVVGLDAGKALEVADGLPGIALYFAFALQCNGEGGKALFFSPSSNT